jgi:hypothetical protein
LNPLAIRSVLRLEEATPARISYVEELIRVGRLNDNINVLTNLPIREIINRRDEARVDAILNDTIPPQIRILGNPNQNITLNGNYIEFGANVTDNLEDDLEVTITGSVDTSRAGVYILRYTARDTAGNEATMVIRTVIVSPAGNDGGFNPRPPNQTIVNPDPVYGRIAILTWRFDNPAPFLSPSSHVVFNDARESFQQSFDTRVFIYHEDSDLEYPPERFGRSLGIGEAEGFFDNDGTRIILIRVLHRDVGIINANVLKIMGRLNPAQVLQVLSAETTTNTSNTSVRGALNWRLYQVNPDLDGWTNSGGIYSPNNQTEFDRLDRVASIINTGTTAIARAGTIPNQTLFSSLNASRTLISWAIDSNDLNQLSDILGTTHPSFNFALVIDGFFVPKETGNYSFTISSDDASDVMINNQIVTSHYGAHALGPIGARQGTISLEAFRVYPLRIRIQDGGGGASGLGFYWRKPSQAGSQNWFQDLEELYAVRPNT